jgi:hypothetical protein
MPVKTLSPVAGLVVQPDRLEKRRPAVKLRGIS